LADENGKVAVYQSWFDGIEKSVRGESRQREHKLFLNRKEKTMDQLLAFLNAQVSISPTI
jgi:hypothetical protein